MNFNIEEVADLALLMYEESPYNIPVSRDHFINVLSSDAVHTFVSFDEETNKITGFILGIINQGHPIWGDVKYAVELAWYVHPDYRGKGTAIKLIDEFESWAVLNTCQFIVLAAMHNSSFDQVKSVYEKRGYTPTEVAFIKELK